MKKTFFFLFFLFFWSISYCQNCIVAKSFGGNTSDCGRSIATDKNGNLYVSGYFYSEIIDFGDAMLTNTDNSGFTSDVFIVKYDSVGNIIWARSFGGMKDDYTFNMVVDSTGCSYMTGTFSSDSISFQSNYFINKGVADMFMMKMDENGIVVWAKTIGSIDHDSGIDVKLDHIGNLLICGGFKSDSLEFDQIKIAKSYIISGFLAKFSNSGNIIWVKELNGVPSSSDVDLHNNITIGGDFYDDTLHIDQSNLVNHSTANSDVFIAKFNESGSLIYAKSFGSVYIDAFNQLKNDSQGNLIFAGNFQGPVTNIDTVVLTSGNWDTFIVKLDSLGNLLWVKQTLSQGGIYAQVVEVDKFDGILITGYTMSQWMTIDSNYILTGTIFGNDQVFTLKFDKNGNSQWSIFFGGSYTERPLGNYVDNGNNLYLVGMFGSSTISLCNTSLININPGTGNGLVFTDVFFAKFSNPPPTTDVNVRENDPESFKIEIFPNPSTGELTIISDIQFDKIVVTNTLGEIYFESAKTEAKKSFIIDRKGIYFITVENKKSILTKKVVIE